MLDLLTSNYDKIAGVVALVAGLLGIVFRNRRNERLEAGTAISDAFSGAGIYTMFHLAIVLFFLDKEKAVSILMKQSDVLTILFAAAFLFFSLEYYKNVIKGGH